MPDEPVEKSQIQKLQDAVVGLVHGAVTDPGGTAGKAAQQGRGIVALGFMVAGQLAHTIADRLMPATTPPPSAPRAPIVDRGQPTPADVARVVEMKPAKKAPAKKAASPSGKLPAKKAPARKAPPKKAPPAAAPSAVPED